MIYTTEISSKLVKNILERVKDIIEDKVKEIPEQDSEIVTINVNVRMLKDVALIMANDKG